MTACPKCGHQLEEQVSWSKGRKVGRAVTCEGCGYGAVRPVEQSGEVPVHEAQRRLVV